jgi:uncharacterized membrane protein YhaH (DUF805 family)
MDAIKALYTTTDGRIGRKQWWIGVTGIILASIVLGIILNIVGLNPQSPLGSLVAVLILLYPNYCLSLKRRHDRNNNGMDLKILLGVSVFLSLVMALGIGVEYVELAGETIATPNGLMSALYFLVALGGIYLFVNLGILKGTEGPNDYGPDPLIVV